MVEIAAKIPHCDCSVINRLPSLCGRLPWLPHNKFTRIYSRINSNQGDCFQLTLDRQIVWTYTCRHVLCYMHALERVLMCMCVARVVRREGVYHDTYKHAFWLCLSRNSRLHETPKMVASGTSECLSRGSACH